MALRFLILLLFCPTLIVRGQESYPLFYTSGMNEGLPHSSVYGLSQDKQGFIWLATPEGLSRYDGNNFHSFKATEVKSIPDASFFRDQPLEDSLQNLWVANSTGIYRYLYASETMERKVAFNNVLLSPFSLDGKGNLWMLQVYKGIFCYNVYSGRSVLYPFPWEVERMHISNRRLATNGKDKFWFSIYDKSGFYEFDLSKRSYRFIKSPVVDNMKWLNGLLYLSTNEGITCYNAAKASFSSFMKLPVGKDYMLSDMVADAAGRTWVGFYGQGLACLDRDGKLIRWYRKDNHHTNTLPSDLITALMIDRSENLWIATDGGGVARLNLKPAAFARFPVDIRDYAELNSFFIRGVYEEENGEVLFGCYNSGLCRLNPVTGQLYRFTEKQQTPKNIITVFKDEAGTIWVGTLEGLVKYDGSRFVPFPLPGKGAYNVFHISGRGKDRILLATYYGPLMLQRSGNGWKAGNLSPDGLLQKEALQLVAASDSLYWVAMGTAGLYLTELRKGEFHLEDSFLTGYDVRYIHRDEERPDILWLATSTGIVFFNTVNHRYAVLNEDSGLSNHNTYGILEDAHHLLWVATNAGLCCYNKKDKTFKSYNYRNGLQGNEFNSGATYKGSSGRLYFGGVNGLNWFTGSSVFYDTNRPQIALTSLIAGNSSLPLNNEQFVLPDDQNSLTVNVSVLDFTNPEANLLMYQLEGWDKEWITASPGALRYPNLLPGDYKLRLIGIGGNKQQSRELVINITINAPFWQQLWFRFLVLVCLVTIIALPIYIIYRRRMMDSLLELRQKRALEAERNRISQDLHDEIGSALTQISLLSELIPIQNKKNEELLKDVHTIAITARKVAMSMGEIVWTLHAEYNTLDSLLAYIRQQVREFLDPLDIDWMILFPDDVSDIHLSGEQRRNLLFVTKEAINNVVKHASATSLEISCVIENSALTFKIIDDGISFTPARSWTFGNGIRNMRQRMRAIGGSIVWLQQEKGTEVVYSLPLKD